MTTEPWQEKRWTPLELTTMPENQFEMFALCWPLGAFRLLGVPYQEYKAAYRDVRTNDFVLVWR